MNQVGAASSKTKMVRPVWRFRLRVPTPARSRKKQARTEPPGVDLLKIVIPLVIGFITGQIAENVKDQRTEFKLEQENRTKVFQTTAASFPEYMVQWQRLIVISATENDAYDRNEKLTAEVELLKDQKRRSFKERAALSKRERELQHSKETLQWIAEQKRSYVAGRNAAFSSLMASLEQAKLFFGPEVHRGIASFDRFDAEAERKPDASATERRREHAAKILTLMKEEISREQKANRRSWYLLF